MGVLVLGLSRLMRGEENVQVPFDAHCEFECVVEVRCFFKSACAGECCCTGAGVFVSATTTRSRSRVFFVIMIWDTNCVSVSGSSNPRDALLRVECDSFVSFCALSGVGIFECAETVIANEDRGCAALTGVGAHGVFE